MKLLLSGTKIVETFQKMFDHGAALALAILSETAWALHPKKSNQLMRPAMWSSRSPNHASATSFLHQRFSTTHSISFRVSVAVQASLPTPLAPSSIISLGQEPSQCCSQWLARLGSTTTFIFARRSTCVHRWVSLWSNF